MFGALQDVVDAIGKLLVSEESVDIGALYRARTQLEAAWLRAVEAYDRSGEWQSQYASSASALRAQCNVSHGAARAEVTLARKLAKLPVVAEALAEASITRRHAAAIAEAYTADRAAAINELEPVLVDAAKVATPREMSEIVLRVTGALDGDDGGSQARRQFEFRSLYASRTFDGMVRGDFTLDPEAGAEFLRAIEVMHEKSSGKDGRSPAQKRADALMNLVRVGAAHADLGAGRKKRPDVLVCVDLADLENRGAPDLAAEIRSRRGPLSKETVRRITCDAKVSRVLTDGPSVVLDVGRAQRTGTEAQFRALVARDGGCTKCGCPPEYTEIHHRHHWSAGGETNLDDLELNCHPCHVEEHEGKYAHRPPWR